MQQPTAFQPPTATKPRRGCMGLVFAIAGFFGLVCLGGAFFYTLGAPNEPVLAFRDAGAAVPEPAVRPTESARAPLVALGSPGPASWVAALAACASAPPRGSLRRNDRTPGMKWYVCPEPLGPIGIAARDRQSWIWSPPTSIATPPAQFAPQGGVSVITEGPAHRADGRPATDVWYRVSSGPLEGAFLDYQVFEDHRELTVFGPRAFATNPMDLWGVPREVLALGLPADVSARCGPERPAVSIFDGELIGSESFIQRTAHDPDSIDVENCTAPVLRPACWESTCDVRGRNAFGALVLNRMTFTVMRGDVVGARPARR